jgi:hypothetical protein
MNVYIIFFVVAIVVGGAAFLIGLKLRSSYGFYSEPVVENYDLVPLDKVSLFKISSEIGGGASRNDDFNFSDVLQHQKDTWPLIENMVSRMKSYE